MARVIHLSSSDIGGAGIAAYRIHSDFILSGISSLMLVENATIDDESIISYSKVNSLTFFLKKVKSRLNFYRRYVANLIDQKYLFFSLFNSRCIKKSDWISSFITDDTEAIFVHWTAGFISLSDVENVIKGRSIKVYINLVDMAHFTGGCHYSFGCNGYEKQCFNCPATSSTKLSRRIRDNIRANAIAVKNMKASAISFSQFTLSQAVNSVVPFDKYHFMRQPIHEDKFFCEYNIETTDEDSVLTKRILMGSYNKNDERKGYFTFLLAMNRLAVLLERSRFKVVVCVPEGDDWSDLEHETISVSYYQKAINDKELRELYLSSDLFVNTSIDDTGPLMLAEALFCGIPVVSSKTGCAIELLSYDNKLGDLVDIMDHNEFAVKIFSRLFNVDSSKYNSKQIGESSKKFYDKAINYTDLVNKC
ncbi:glycosyltransferase [Shewanella xiamenensis]|uniref:glycosyltransferase n=1 Tax=Shewanella xiamenensis TaxID=332186 RepID=UPI00313B147D